MERMMLRLLPPLLGLSVLTAYGSDPWAIESEELNRYFERHVAELERPLASIQRAQDWEKQRPELRRQLHEMLGLDPLPERTELKPVITGTLKREGYSVEKLHFQSRPGLYVTANFYIPDSAKETPVPAILYVCGHGRVKIDGVSYGNKTHYHHHGVWFARNGYACLTIDTLQLGEIEGVHHGTHNLGRWWWNARGYSPAGVEAWNGIRAVDYLESRPEVDKSRIGVTGRSGGGAYSWWAATLDERVQCAVPVAGIASLRNHVVDGCVEGHCDCMFPVNTYRWDFAKVSSLVSPRALLLSNTDKDRIFPLDGVTDVFFQTRHIYELEGAGDKLGLNIEEGPHKDTQPLRTSAFHWFNRHFKGMDIGDTFAMAATKEFEPAELKVFEEIPADEKNTTIDESFVPLAPASKVPASETEWKTMRDEWMTQLRAKSFRGWPDPATKPEIQRSFSSAREGVRLEVYALHPQPDVTCHLYVIRNQNTDLADLDLMVLNLLDESDWSDFLTHIPSLFPEAFPGVELPEADTESLEAELQMHERFKWGMAYLCPRGIGASSWPGDEKKQTHIRRRFALIGQGLDAMRAWDTHQACVAVRDLGLGAKPLWVQAQGAMAGNALYASLFLDTPPARLDLHQLPASHHDGPYYLNVMRILDMPQALAMAREHTKIRLYTSTPEDWTYANEVADALGWSKDSFQTRKPVAEEPE